MILFFILILTIFVHPQKYTKNKVTILHTNDIHGNIYRYRPVPWTKADANIAEFNNLILHMKKNAENAGNEIVLVFDSGDLVQGSGLSDATPVYGTFIFETINKLPYNGITIGNHELNGEDSIENIVTNVAPMLGERYISGNVHHSNSSKVMAKPYRLMEVEGFGEILVLGFLFNCTWGNPTVVTTPVANAVKEDWFVEVVKREDLRLIVVLGHMDLTMEEGQILFSSIRTLRSDNVAVVFLGGHTHQQQVVVNEEDHTVFVQSFCHFELLGIIKLDYKEEEEKTTIKEKEEEKEEEGGEGKGREEGERKGRETIGEKQWNAEVTFINTTVDEFKRVAGFTGSQEEWMLPESREILDMIEKKIAELHLNDVVGCVPELNLTVAALADLAYRAVKPLVDPQDGKTKGTVFVSIFPTLPGPTGPLFLDDIYTLDGQNTPMKVVRNVAVNDLKEVVYNRPHGYYASEMTVFEYPYYDVIGIAAGDVWNALKEFNPSANYQLEESSTVRNRDVLLKFVLDCLVCGDTHIFDCIIPDDESSLFVSL